MLDRIEIELALAAGIMVLVLFCVGIRKFTRPRELTVIDFGILAIGIFFGFGPISSYVVSEGSLTNEALDNIIGAYVVVALFIIGFSATPYFARLYMPGYKTGTIWEIFEQARTISWHPMIGIHIAVWTVRLIIARNYGILFYGTGTESRILSMSYELVVTQNIVEFLGASAFIWSTVRVWTPSSRITFWMALFVLISGILWAAMQGRRTMFVYSFLFFFSYAATYNTVRLRQAILASLFFGVLLLFVFPVLIRLRMSHNDLGIEDDAFGHVYHTTVGATRISNQDLNMFYKENMMERPLIIRFICKILASQDKLPLMKGEALWTSIKWTIPSFIYKEKIGTVMAEQYIQQFYYHPMVDTSLTWAATGCADWGIPGGFVTGLILGHLSVFIQLFSKRLSIKYPILAISSIGLLLIELTNAETDPLSIFNLIRTAMLLYVAARTLRFFGVSETFYMEPYEHDAEAHESEFQKLELINSRARLDPSSDPRL